MCLPAITDSLFMLASGIQAEVQRGLNWLHGVKVADLSDSFLHWLHTLNVAEMSDSLTGAVAKAAEHVFEWICGELFQGTAKNCFGGSGQKEQSGQGARFESSRSQAEFEKIPKCTSDEVIRRMERTELYQTFDSKARRILVSNKGTVDDCRAMKTAVKQLFLLMHPDKFNADHLECPRDASVKATMIVSMTYREAKSKCSMRR
jgi:hypothetical protein